MTIKNSTRQTIISQEAFKTTHYFETVKGLIGEKRAKTLLFQTHFGIHTFGLKFPIDVLVLDKKNKVIAKKQNLKANSFFVWNPLYSQVIELPNDTIEKTRTQIGDQLSFS